MKRFLFMVLLLLGGYQASAQSFSVSGKVVDATDKSALPGATVILTRLVDSTQSVAATDTQGAFKLSVPAGNYRLNVTFLGYQTFQKSVPVLTATDVGTLSLALNSQVLGEVKVVGKIPPGEQKGDTTQFNAAAFKTAPDASAEDLVQKMPGITVTNGTLQAQGQDVKQVLVDGKRFFSDDPSAALRSLPADVIANIQIFDKKSDQAEFSGVDDGHAAKTINIITKPDKRKGQFGKASAGYGSDGKYMVGAAVNSFNGDQRLTLTGLTNNINLLDFSIGETPGGGMRGRRPPMGGGTPSGLISTNTIGLNYSDLWGKKIEVSGNYKFTDRTIGNNQFRIQNYTLPSDSGQVYNENRLSSTATASHVFNFRLDYNLNPNNRLLITPSLTVEDNSSTNQVSSATSNVNGALNTSENSTVASSKALTFNNNILFSHKFGKTGRNLSASLNTSYSTSNGDNTLAATSLYYRGTNTNAFQNLFTQQKRNTFSWVGDLTYNEPVGKNGHVQLIYNLGNQLNDADKKAYELDAEGSGTYSQLNQALSNTFQSGYFTQRFGTGYQYNQGKLRLRVNTRYQLATLEVDQEYPSENTYTRRFTSILPSADMNLKISQSKNFDFNYNTSTNAPSVDQLSEAIDNTNPLLLYQGNPSLLQTYSHSFRTGFRNFNTETNRIFFVGVFGNLVQNYVGNSITRATAEPITLANGVVLEKGQQLTTPVNLDGYVNVRSVFHLGQPVNWLKSNVGVHGSVGYTRTPGLTNGELNIAKAPNVGVGLSLSSNISEKIDFNLSTNSSYNFVHNSLPTQQSNNYFTQNTNLKYNWIFGPGLVYRTELNHQYNSGLSAGLDANYLLWNMSISKKLFKNQQGELSLSVNDLLNQNVSVQRNFTAQYVEDVQSSVLQRFFMLTFTYNLRNFTGSAPAEPSRDRGFPGPPPGGLPGGPPPPQG
ncbi:outer membrane beta-barrel protein [Sabulibacter ruber]|uniref:outer membrane beta-barrel protein n=1 Tax=Sabulibacter ruber TaxID=2811901 RepID=UPI001A95D5A3|nr:outer membrane beta-barrel protein [Sabulibacter ruber]